MTWPAPPPCARPLASQAGRRRLPGLLRDSMPGAPGRPGLRLEDLQHQTARAVSSELACGRKPDPAAGPDDQAGTAAEVEPGGAHARTPAGSRTGYPAGCPM